MLHFLVSAATLPRFYCQTLERRGEKKRVGTKDKVECEGGIKKPNAERSKDKLRLIRLPEDTVDLASDDK